MFDTAEVIGNIGKVLGLLLRLRLELEKVDVAFRLGDRLGPMLKVDERLRLGEELKKTLDAALRVGERLGLSEENAVEFSIERIEDEVTFAEVFGLDVVDTRLDRRGEFTDMLGPKVGSDVEFADVTDTGLETMLAVEEVLELLEVVLDKDDVKEMLEGILDMTEDAIETLMFVFRSVVGIADNTGEELMLAL